MGHPAFRQQPAAGTIAHSASSLRPTHTHGHAHRKAHKRGAYTKRFRLRVGTRRSSLSWEGSSSGGREGGRELVRLSSLLLSLTSPAGNRPCTGLWSTDAFTGPCVRIFTPRPFLPHSFSQPGCIRSHHRRRYFLLLPPSKRPSPRWLDAVVS